MNILFTEFLPSQELLPYIQTYWLGNFNVLGEKNFSQSVMPTGCIELIIHITSDHCALSRDDEEWSKSPEFTLVGLYDKPYEVQFYENVKVFGIRFFPDGIRQIFGVPPSEFLASYEDGAAVLGKELKEFCSKIREAESATHQVALANSFISTQLATHCLRHDYTHIAMKMIRERKGIGPYQELASGVPISVRQLQREFKALYGITVSDYMRISRMNAIHNYMMKENRKLTELSYELNFTDQSHFIREFKTYSGIAPKKFLKNRDHFIVNSASNVL